MAWLGRTPFLVAPCGRGSCARGGVGCSRATPMSARMPRSHRGPPRSTLERGRDTNPAFVGVCASEPSQVHFQNLPGSCKILTVRKIVTVFAKWFIAHPQIVVPQLVKIVGMHNFHVLGNFSHQAGLQFAAICGHNLRYVKKSSYFQSHVAAHTGAQICATANQGKLSLTATCNVFAESPNLQL